MYMSEECNEMMEDLMNQAKEELKDEKNEISTDEEIKEMLKIVYSVPYTESFEKMSARIIKQEKRNKKIYDDRIKFLKMFKKLDKLFSNNYFDRKEDAYFILAMLDFYIATLIPCSDQFSSPELNELNNKILNTCKILKNMIYDYSNMKDS